MVHDLEAFRIYNVLVEWESLTFSTRLTELRIQEVMLGYDDKLISLLEALSSAPNLRNLEIISVSTFCDPVARGRNLAPRITLSALQSLSVEDLYVNTLESLFSAIAPGSYSLTLYLSLKSIDTNFLDDETTDDESEIGDVYYLCGVLRHIPVDTLMISGLNEGAWLADSELVDIVKAIPTLKTLKLDTWIYDEELCKGLTRPKRHKEPARINPFPALQNLHLTTVDVRSKKNFKRMISSHPLKQVILGGQILADQVSGWKPVQEDSIVVQRPSRCDMPDLDLQVVDKDFRSPEFYLYNWKVW